MDKCTPEELSAFKAVFKSFDVDGDNTIDVTELGNALGKLGREVTPAEVATMIARVDTDGGGSIEFPEFVMLLKSLKERDEKEEEDSDAEPDDEDASGIPEKSTISTTLRRLSQCIEKSNEELQADMDTLSAARALILPLLDKDPDKFMATFRQETSAAFQVMHEKGVMIGIEVPFASEATQEPSTLAEADNRVKVVSS